ncbi:MAG: hypothetical protein ABJB76_05030 [Candidatus Nitrosocosmicus sp.]
MRKTEDTQIPIYLSTASSSPEFMVMEEVYWNIAKRDIFILK